MSVATSSAEPQALPEVPAANLGWLLGQASHVLQTKLTAALEDLGITPRAFCLLSTAMAGDFTQSELAATVGVDKTTMVVTMDELEAAGLARRVPSATDRRVRVIAITEEGERKAAQAEDVVARVQDDVLSALPPRERKQFVEALTQLVADSLATPAPCQKPPRRRSAS